MPETSDDDTDADTDDDERREKEENEKRGQTPLKQEEFCHSFGAIKVYTIEKTEEGEGDDIKQAIPLVANYSNRGLSLANFSRSEYDALIQIKGRRSKLDTDNSFHIRSEQFLFFEGFEPYAYYAQFLRAKQRTLIYYGKGPKHPGNKPSTKKTGKQFKNWERKADIFAKYYLIAYRPETECYNGNQQSTLLYNWDALQSWVKELQEDSCILSKFRLQAFYNRLHALDADYKTKIITTMYRARNRTIWSDEQKNIFNRERILEQVQKQQHQFDEHEFETTHAELTERQNHNLENQFNDNSFLIESLVEVLNKEGDYPILSHKGSSNLTLKKELLELQTKFTNIMHA
jgi:hypothetical protein